MNVARPLFPTLLIALALNASAAHAQRAPAAAASQGASVSRLSGALIQPLNASESRQALEEHTFRVTAGQLVEARVDADGFDTVLQLIPPSGDTLYNDDFESTRTSRIATIATVGGEWKAIVSALDQGSGDYGLVITLGTPGKTRAISGTLTESTPISAKGHRFERHTYVVEDAVQLVVQLTSRGFEPEIVLHSPSGEIVAQSVDASSPNQVTATVPSAETGTWEIVATHSAYSDPTTGGYAIQIVETAPIVLPDGDLIRGVLSESTPRQIHGEHYQEHTLAGSADGEISVMLESGDFDAFLAARSPSGEWFRDDDSGGDGNAMLSLPAGAGEWLVIVTTYSADEVGRYELKVFR